MKVKVELHPIDRNLHQVWASAVFKEGEQYVPGAETETYVFLTPGAAPRAAAPPPVPVRPQTPPQPQSPPPPPVPPQRGTQLGVTLELMTPTSQGFCATDTPWLLGERYLEDGARLPSGGCVALEAQVSAPARVFLVGQDPQGRLRRLFPSTCAELGRFSNSLTAEEVFRFPPRGNPACRPWSCRDRPGPSGCTRWR